MNIEYGDDLLKKITVDILMGIAIILEFVSLPILIHEIIGIGLVFLIILHINFNKNYFKAIPKGKYTLKRTIDLIINIGLLISLSITIISGICSSQKSLRNLTSVTRRHLMKTSMQNGRSCPVQPWTTSSAAFCSTSRIILKACFNL